MSEQSVHMEAWVAVVRCLLKLEKKGAVPTHPKETGIEWAVRVIEEYAREARSVSGLRARIVIVEQERDKWRAQTIEEVERTAKRVGLLKDQRNASVKRAAESDRQRGLAHDQVARLHREVRGLRDELSEVERDRHETVHADVARANHRIQALKIQLGYALMKGD